MATASSSGRPLALTGGQEGLALRTDQSGVIDSLPYIDTLSPEEKATVDRLIQDEVGFLCYRYLHNVRAV